MPTVLTLDGLRVVIYPNDHRPAHVHVIGPGEEAVFDLHCPGGPPELRDNFGFTRAALNSIAHALSLALNKLCIDWRRIHGDY